MNQNHYLNYAVWNKVVNHHLEPTLMRVNGGYFASSAWMISDEAYSKIAGTKFGGLFGDDATTSFVSKFDVRRLRSDEEFEQLYNSSCLNFKIMIKLLDLMSSKISKLPIEAKYKAHMNMSDFKDYGHRFLTRLAFTDMPNNDDLESIVNCVLTPDKVYE